MEQRLIDGLSLWAEMKRLEELARNRYLDTPSSSPVHTRYCEQMQERTSLKEMVSAMPTIDPIYAAGACYCRECLRSREIKDQKTGELVYCNFFDEPMNKTDFCSYGERREPNE